MSSPYGYDDDDDGDIDWVFDPMSAADDTFTRYYGESPFASSSSPAPAHGEWDRPSLDIENPPSAAESAANASQQPPEPSSPVRQQPRSPSRDRFLRHIEAEQRERSRDRRDRQALLRDYRAAREALRDRRARLAALQAAFTLEPEAELDFHQTDDDFDPLDELFEMEVNDAPRNPLRRRRQPQPSSPAPLPEAQRPQQRDPTVIDLTEEPDSPILTFQPLTLPRSNPPSQSHPGLHRNPRRQMSLGHRTPSLARSDGSLLGANGAVAVIDLTGDSPDEPAPRAAAREPRAHRRAREEPHENRFRAEVSFFAQLSAIRQRFNDALPHIFGAHQPIDAEVQFIGQNHANMNPLANNPVRFNYRANGFGGSDGGRQPSPKPAHVPPPAPREGFTRDTGDDLAFVCPSCDEELKYDSDDEEQEQRPAKKARTLTRSSKATEEHHFWAVKNCGHVYCKKCFENRRGGPKATWHTTFSRDDVKNPKTFCAVDGCDSDVTRKEAWVGIFL